MYSKSKAKARKNEEIELQNKANELRLKAERKPADKRILNELLQQIYVSKNYCSIKLMVQSLEVK